MLHYTGIALAAGFLLDLAIGDPRWLYHPVRLIGKLIDRLETHIRKVFPKTPGGELAGGIFLVIGVVLVTVGVTAGILHMAYGLHAAAGFALESFMCYQMLAVRSLKDESMLVYDALTSGKESSLADGRDAVSRIVGRDTQNLDETGVTKAAVETVAENFGDGVFAPMFYMALGGPVCMYLYKAINTMDSMLGYKNERFLYFGRAAAKLDDVVNFIPARMAGILLVISAWIGPFDGKNAGRIFARDRRKHASPNSAHTEAAAAGALDIQLAGDAYYFGKLYEKPLIGDPLQEVVPDDIRRMNRLMYGAAFLSVAVLSAISFLLYR
mgnify:FL=1